MRNDIIDGMEKLMIKIINNNIPKRSDLPNTHTLKEMEYWRGADLVVIDDLANKPNPNSWYGSDEYIFTKNAYELSWILCEIRDIYGKNNFFMYELKYHLYDKFASRYKIYQNTCSNEKEMALKTIQDLIYSNEYNFLPSLNDANNIDIEKITIDNIEGEG